MLIWIILIIVPMLFGLYAQMKVHSAYNKNVQIPSRGGITGREAVNLTREGLDYGTIQPAAGSTVRQEVKLQQGISTEKARDIIKAIKDSKKKVQASINGDFIRVSGKDRDVLQEVIHLLRSNDFGLDLQFTNYR